VGLGSWALGWGLGPGALGLGPWTLIYYSFNITLMLLCYYFTIIYYYFIILVLFYRAAALGEVKLSDLLA